MACNFVWVGFPAGLPRHGFKDGFKAAHVAFRQMSACPPRMSKFDGIDNNFIQKAHVYELPFRGCFTTLSNRQAGRWVNIQATGKF
jgi:hypothetical protein